MKCQPILLIWCIFSALTCHAQLDEAATLQRSLGQFRDSLQYVDALNRIAFLSYEKNIDSTFDYTVRARQIADRLSYDKGKADALNNLGVVFDIKGNHQLALKYYSEASLAYTKLSDTANRVQTFMNLAGVYKQLGRNDRAIEQFEAAITLGEQLRQDSILSLVIYNYLLQYPERFSPATVKQHIQKAREIATRYKDERTLIAIDHLIADELISNGERQKGLALLDSTINLAIRRKLYYVSMDMLIAMGDHLAAEDTDKAITYYSKGLDIANQNHFLFYSQLTARRLFDLYSTQHEYAKTAAYGRLLIELHDEQEQLNNESGIDYLDYAIKEQQITALATKSMYQSFFLVLAILICLLALWVIILIRRTLKKTENLNKQINEQNKQMRTALTALEQSQADNTHMMQIVAHDLRNPIGAIGSAASLMLDENERPAHDSTMLKLIRKSAEDSLELVSELLHVHVRGEDIPKEPIDLDQMLHYCVDLLGSKAAAKEQHIELSSRPSTILANREKLWRVLSNLIANAIKFSPLGEVILVTLEVKLKRVLIAVKDHGIGIPEEIGIRIFDMFTEARRPGTAGEQPFGLGLAISKQIIEAHGGQICFESYPGKGTTFFVELPAG